MPPSDSLDLLIYSPTSSGTTATETGNFLSSIAPRVSSREVVGPPRVTPPPIGSTHTSTNQYCGLLRTNRCEESDGRLLRPSASRRAACHWTRGEFLELASPARPVLSYVFFLSYVSAWSPCADSVLSCTDAPVLWADHY